MATCGRCGAFSADETAAFCGSCGFGLAAPPLANDGGSAPKPPARAQGTIPAAPISSALAIGEPVEVGPPAVGAVNGTPLAPPAGAPRDKPFTKPQHLAAGTLIDKKYAVLRVLGEGGMGVVYLARDIHTGLDVVVKAVRSELAHRDDVRARTLAEGRALAQIDHPNVVHLRAVAVDGPHLFLVMQYIDGESLDKIIARHVERHEPMPVDEALAIFRQVAAGVGAAHQEGVIHRDLKPANVLLRRKDKVAKVTDFGIALVPGDTSRPHTRGILGSLWYMSPEQVTGRRDLDQRVDVYALGIMLYQMLVGHVPFDAKSDYEIMKLHAEAPMPLAAAARPDLPPGVDDLIQKACSKDRDHRFHTCEELVAAVDCLLGLGPAGPTPAIPLVSAATSSPGAAPIVPPGPPTAYEGRPSPTLTVTASRPGEQGDALPGEELEKPRRAGLWIGLALTVTVAAAGTTLALGLVPGVPDPFGFVGVRAHPRHADAGAPSSSAHGSDAGANKPGLDSLVGSWVGNGRELEAVAMGNEVEFRVKKPEQFAPQSYEAGEARFVLRATADPNVFAVEDRIRPVPPLGKIYEARARGTCQEVWTTVAGDALRARRDGARLSVEFAKIEPGAANFTMEGGKVSSCVGLRDLKASKVVSVLIRP